MLSGVVHGVGLGGVLALVGVAGGEEEVGGGAAGAGDGGDAGAQAFEVVEPECFAVEGIEAVGVADDGDDEAVTIEEDSGVAGAFWGDPGPEGLAGVAVEGDDAGVEAQENEVFEHGEAPFSFGG